MITNSKKKPLNKVTKSLLHEIKYRTELIKSETKERDFIKKILEKLEALYASYDYIQFTIASPPKIRSWAQRKTPQGILGEVYCTDTINFRTRQPEPNGLFCQKIFGPVINWRCKCKRYDGRVVYLNRICEKCLVELTEARVRRYRMGYIQLAVPIAHFWYFKGVPNYLLYLLRFYFPKIRYKDIQNILYYRDGIKLDRILRAQLVEPKSTHKFGIFCQRAVKMKGLLGKYYEDSYANLRQEALLAREYRAKVELLNAIQSTKEKVYEEKYIKKYDEENQEDGYENDLEENNEENNDYEKNYSNEEYENNNNGFENKKSKKKENKKIQKKLKDKNSKEKSLFENSFLKDLYDKPKSVSKKEENEDEDDFDDEEKEKEKGKDFDEDEDEDNINYEDEDFDNFEINESKLAEILSKDESSILKQIKAIKEELLNDEDQELFLSEEEIKELLTKDFFDQIRILAATGVLEPIIPKEDMHHFSEKELIELALETDFHKLLFTSDIEDYERFKDQVYPTNSEKLKDKQKTLPSTKKVHAYLYRKSWRNGGELIQCALLHMNPSAIVGYLELKGRQKKLPYNHQTYTKLFRIFYSFIWTETNPSWIFLTSLAILPPTLRPFVEVESGKLISSDINELYRIVINRNRTLANSMFEARAVGFLVVNNRKLVQEIVDNLINNARVGKYKQAKANEKPLKSLTEVLEGKFGRFRHNLLGKRVDYSGRSVIVVNPQLQLNQCGLPYLLGLELFKPILLKSFLKNLVIIKESGYTDNYNLKRANLLIQNDYPFLWILLENIMRESAVLLNRAPTLHKFGVQSFFPFPILGKAIQLHPLVCTGFNADFDGDQMAVHLPLYKTTQLELQTMLKPSVNVLSPANGEVILKPSQDMVIGCYYLTIMVAEQEVITKIFFADKNDLLYALSQKQIQLHTPTFLRYSFEDYFLEYQDGNIFLIQRSTYLHETERYFVHEKIEIYNCFKSITNDKKEIKKIYFFTNLGIFFVKQYQEKENLYEITDFFLETTAGRVLIETTVKTFFS